MKMGKHESGTAYGSLGDVPVWAVDRGRVLNILTTISKSSDKAAGEITSQGSRVTVLETRLDERTKDIAENAKATSKVRHAHNTTIGVQAQLVKDVERLEREVKELNARSVIALGGGGAAGGGVIAGVIELVRYLM